MRRATPVAVRHTDRAPALHDHPLRDAMRPQLHAVPQSHRPVHDVGRRLRLDRATHEARAAVIAGVAVTAIDRVDRGVGRPPVPAHRVEAARRRRAHSSDR